MLKLIMDNPSKTDIKILCSFCFDTLIAQLGKKELPVLEEKYSSAKFPLFVTWTKGKDKELRGCIGTFTEEPLGKNLGKYALVSSLEDRRFKPVTEQEVENLNVAVSLLTNFEDAKDPEDWEVGKHGIQISFELNGHSYGGTFLPEVAAEQNWDKITTLRYLVQKAGKRGNINFQVIMIV